MKHLVLLLSILILTISGFAQYEAWSTPQLMTTEGADCFGGKIDKINLDPTTEYLYYLVYNKVVNDSTIGIFARAAYNTSTEYEIYCQNGKICAYNGIMNNDYPEIHEPMIFFEIADNSEEQRDIFYLNIDTEGNLSEPVPFAVTVADEHNLNCTRELDWVVWQCADTIKTKNYTYYYSNDTLIISDDILIEAGNCHDPIVTASGYTTIRYIKDYVDYKEIREAKKDYNEPEFEIITRFEAEELNCLRRTESNFNWEDGFASWQRFDGTYKIFACRSYEWSEIDSLEWTQEKPFNPSFYELVFLVDGTIDAERIALQLDNDTTQDIYASIEFIPENTSALYNVSKSDYFVQNPIICRGKDYQWSHDIIIVYEEIREGKRHLMTSRQNIVVGGTNENLSANNNITISPNPITSNFSVTINNPESNAVQFTLYSLNGMKSKTLSRNVNAGSVNKIPFSVEDFGNDVTPGSYVFECRDGEKVEFIKIMIL